MILQKDKLYEASQTLKWSAGHKRCIVCTEQNCHMDKMLE